jgi:hypothetical protein
MPVNLDANDLPPGSCYTGSGGIRAVTPEKPQSGLESRTIPCREQQQVSLFSEYLSPRHDQLSNSPPRLAINLQRPRRAVGSSQSTPREPSPWHLRLSLMLNPATSSTVPAMISGILRPARKRLTKSLVTVWKEGRCGPNVQISL